MDFRGFLKDRFPLQLIWNQTCTNIWGIVYVYFSRSSAFNHYLDSHFHIVDTRVGSSLSNEARAQLRCYGEVAVLRMAHGTFPCSVPFETYSWRSA